MISPTDASAALEVRARHRGSLDGDGVDKARVERYGDRLGSQRHAREIVELVDGKLRLVAVADTHSRPHSGAEALIAKIDPHHILHAGDIGELAVLDGLRKIAPVLAVRGNIDTQAGGLADTMTIDVQEGGRSLVRLVLLHIAVYGPKIRADARRLAEAEKGSLVVCGHSHVPFAARDRGLTVFNPGSIGPRRFGLPIVFGVIEIARDGISVRHVDAETGERWLPGGPA